MKKAIINYFSIVNKSMFDYVRKQIEEDIEQGGELVPEEIKDLYENELKVSAGKVKKEEPGLEAEVDALLERLISSIKDEDEYVDSPFDYNTNVYESINHQLKSEEVDTSVAKEEPGTAALIKQLEAGLKSFLSKQQQVRVPIPRALSRAKGRIKLIDIEAPRMILEGKEKAEIPTIKKMEELLKNDPKLKDKLIKFLEQNKAKNFYIPSLKKSIYISRPQLDKLRSIYVSEKEGGFLPLIPLLAGIAAAGSVAGGAAGIASAVNKKRAEDAALFEQKRHNISLEDAARGKGLKDDVVSFVKENELDEDVKRLVKKTLKGLSAAIPMRKEGSSLILTPYKQGSSLILWK